MPQKQYVLDASVLISAVNSQDPNHVPCYSFVRNKEDAQWILPTIAYFEFHATQSRLKREGKKAIREVYLGNAKLYELNQPFIQRCSEMDLFNKFHTLRGADLVYGCIAAVEGVPLVTSDRGFGAVGKFIKIVWL